MGECGVWCVGGVRCGVSVGWVVSGVRCVLSCECACAPIYMPCPNSRAGEREKTHTYHTEQPRLDEPHTVGPDNLPRTRDTPAGERCTATSLNQAVQ